jgi:hypothetical protein
MKRNMANDSTYWLILSCYGVIFSIYVQEVQTTYILG